MSPALWLIPTVLTAAAVLWGVVISASRWHGWVRRAAIGVDVLLGASAVISLIILLVISSLVQEVI